jgi:hypothetical protein
MSTGTVQIASLVATMNVSSAFIVGFFFMVIVPQRIQEGNFLWRPTSGWQMGSADLLQVCGFETCIRHTQHFLPQPLGTDSCLC